MFYMKHVLSLILCCTLLLAAMSDSITFSTVDKGFYSGIKESMNKAIQTSSEFDDFWSNHTSRSFPPDGVSDINFDEEMVLCVFRGTMKSGGYGVEIKAVEDIGDEVLVSCETKDPPPGAMVTMALTQPFHIVRAPKSPNNVRFECVAEEPPPPPFPVFIVSFEKGGDPEAVVETIKDLDAVESVQFLRSVKIAFVNFDPTKIDKFAAAALLQGLEGVATAEADPPMHGSPEMNIGLP